MRPRTVLARITHASTTPDGPVSTVSSSPGCWRLPCYSPRLAEVGHQHAAAAQRAGLGPRPTGTARPCHRTAAGAAGAGGRGGEADRGNQAGELGGLHRLAQSHAIARVRPSWWVAACTEHQGLFASFSVSLGTLGPRRRAGLHWLLPLTLHPGHPRNASSSTGGSHCAVWGATGCGFGVRRSAAGRAGAAGRPAVAPSATGRWSGPVHTAATAVGDGPRC